MGTQLTVTPGITWQPTTPGNAANFNLLGQPVVAIPTGGIQATDLDTADIATAMADLFRFGNILTNGNFWPQTFSTPGGVSAPAATMTTNALGWSAFPTGAAITYARSAEAPDTKSTYAAKFTGAASVTEAALVTYLSPDVTAQYPDEDVVFSIYIRNQSGATFTPELQVFTSDNLADESNITVRIDTASASTAGDGAWSRHQWTFDTGDQTNWTNGAQFRVIIPSPALDDPGKTVSFAQAQLEPGTAFTSYMRPVYYHSTDPYNSPPGSTTGGYAAQLVTKDGAVYLTDFSALTTGKSALVWNGASFSPTEISTKKVYRAPGSVSDGEGIYTSDTQTAPATFDSGTWTVPGWFPSDATRAIFRGYWWQYYNSPADATYAVHMGDLSGGSNVGTEMARIFGTPTTNHREVNLSEFEVPLYDNAGTLSVDWAVEREALTASGSISNTLRLRVVGYRTD